MWETVTLVSSPIGLAAFVTAVVATVIRWRTKSKLDVLKTLPKDQRLSAIQGYHFREGDLSDAQRYKLILQQLESRERTTTLLIKATAPFAIILFLILAIAYIFVLNPKIQTNSNVDRPRSERDAAIDILASISEQIDLSTSLTGPPQKYPHIMRLTNSLAELVWADSELDKYRDNPKNLEDARIRRGQTLIGLRSAIEPFRNDIAAMASAEELTDTLIKQSAASRSFLGPLHADAVEAKNSYSMAFGAAKELQMILKGGDPHNFPLNQDKGKMASIFLQTTVNHLPYATAQFRKRINKLILSVKDTPVQ